MKKLIMFGTGNYAESIFYWLSNDSEHEVAAFTVDQNYVDTNQFCGLPLVSFENVEDHFPPSEFDMFLPISFQRMNRFREERYLQAKEKGYALVNYISSRSSTWDDIQIGDNCLIAPLCSVEPYANIGSNVTIGPTAVIGHHAVIGDHSFIAPGAVVLGGVTVGAYSVIGANATLKESAKVATDCLIGAGVTVSNDTADMSVLISPTPRLLDQTSEQLRDWLTWPVRGGTSD